MSFKDKLKNFINPVEEDEVLELSAEEARISEYEKPKNRNISKIPADTKMVLFEPRSFDEAEEVARHLKGKRAAVVNLHRLPREYSQRSIDFLTGVVFALDGTIQKIGHNVILCTPQDIGVSGEIRFDAEEE
ncbi:MAG: cell division protein SepF [Firmicutes bacterium HGW-Firmicutes-10]|jgi:cell division inhibitor SepF|nr:cell division protein SepF [Erysipelothrix sp.]PKM65035.1 MAG: cell division protein SepF [Firmicutes bacterium HGW-Firmicutes-19]PKM87714.1 MAG: cell division protein SepF [Firmicutes bacterium HGW-Firmicutes-10]